MTDDKKTIAILHSSGLTELRPEWCQQDKHNIDTEFHSFPEDGECSCGVHKHHVHCTHGGIIQIG